MKKLIPLTAVLTGFLISGVLPLWAQPSTDPIEATVQSLGSRTRAEIAKVSQRGANSDRALRFQEEGDQALYSLAVMIRSNGHTELTLKRPTRDRAIRLLGR